MSSFNKINSSEPSSRITTPVASFIDPSYMVDGDTPHLGSSLKNDRSYESLDTGESESNGLHEIRQEQKQLAKKKFKEIANKKCKPLPIGKDKFCQFSGCKNNTPAIF